MATNPAPISSSVTVVPLDHMCIYFLDPDILIHFCSCFLVLLSGWGFSRTPGLLFTPPVYCQVDGNCRSAAPWGISANPHGFCSTADVMTFIKGCLLYTSDAADDC